MNALVSWTIALLLLGAPAEALGDLLKGQREVEIRAYLLNRDRSVVPVNGISALLVTRDLSGTEKLLPMTIVWAKNGGEKAPHRWLPIRAVEGTPYVAALCAIHPCGSVLEEPESLEPGDSVDKDRMRVETDVPYFKAEVPSEAVLSPGGCALALRFRIQGIYRSTAEFPRLQLPKNGSACAPWKKTPSELALVERHLQMNELRLAGVDLDRIWVCLSSDKPRAQDEPLHQDCLEEFRPVRSAFASGERAQEAVAARELRQLSARGDPTRGGLPAALPE
jgi:hypothetical protein